MDPTKRKKHVNKWFGEETFGESFLHCLRVLSTRISPQLVHFKIIFFNLTKKKEKEIKKQETQVGFWDKHYLKS